MKQGRKEQEDGEDKKQPLTAAPSALTQWSPVRDNRAKSAVGVRIALFPNEGPSCFVSCSARSFGFFQIPSIPFSMRLHGGTTANLRHRRAACDRPPGNPAADRVRPHGFGQVHASPADVARPRAAGRRTGRDPAAAPAGRATPGRPRRLGTQGPTRPRSRLPDSLRERHQRRYAHPLRHRGPAAAPDGPGHRSCAALRPLSSTSSTSATFTATSRWPARWICRKPNGPTSRSW